MMNSKTTKRALLSSVIALLVCFAMLLGTTFAWFTDTAKSTDNVIKSGKLDIELYQWNGAVTDDRANAVPMGSESPAVFPSDIKWEPGYTHVVYLSIKNLGDLSLKYKVALEVTEVSNKSLLDVMSYAVSPDAQFGSVTSWAGNGTYLQGTYTEDAKAQDVELKPGDEHFFALSVHMDEDAGNEYMNQSVTFDVIVLAAQLADEIDGLGTNNYDRDASYAYTGKVTISDDITAYMIPVTDGQYKVGSVSFTSNAVADGADEVKVSIKKTEYDTSNITVQGGETYENLATKSFDVKVEGINGTTPVKVQVRIEPGFDPDTVKLFHYDTEIPCTYDPNTGYVTFESATFSPFTVAYDAESEYVFPEVPKDDEGNVIYPKAEVSYASQHVNVELPWGNVGGFAPTEGLDSKLEAAFVFKSPDELDEVYAQWYCDFFVSLDRDLGENEIFLGGNYGSFGWIGFHNGDIKLPANEEIGLLSSVTRNPWTYENIHSLVNEFTCGVGDVDNALDGATFTVCLRLINPEHETVKSAISNEETRDTWWAYISEDAYIDVNVVTYKFGGTYNIQ